MFNKGQLAGLMKQAQAMQDNLKKAQEELAQIEVEGQSGGGMVRIRCTAKGRILGVSIDDSLMVPAEKQMLEDLITAAFNDARSRADQKANEEMMRVQQSAGLPPGFDLSKLGL